MCAFLGIVSETDLHLFCDDYWCCVVYVVLMFSDLSVLGHFAIDFVMIFGGVSCMCVLALCWCVVCVVCVCVFVFVVWVVCVVLRVVCGM